MPRRGLRRTDARTRANQQSAATSGIRLRSGRTIQQGQPPPRAPRRRRQPSAPPPAATPATIYHPPSTKWHFSCFLITANTNRTRALPIASTVNSILMNLLQDDSSYFWRTTTGWTSVPAGTSMINRYSLRVNVENYDEVGPTLHRVHCHGLLVIQHKGWIRLDRQKLQSAMMAAFIPYFNVSWVRADLMYAFLYAVKSMPGAGVNRFVSLFAGAHSTQQMLSAAEGYASTVVGPRRSTRLRQRPSASNNNN